MTSTYKLTCPWCGHKAMCHAGENGISICMGSLKCSCTISAASLYAAECERLRTIVRWAREFVAQEESAMGDVNDRTHAYQQLRTALDAGEQDNG